MSRADEADAHERADVAPGDERLDDNGVAQGAQGYIVGLVLAAGLTAASLFFARGGLIWGPGVATALVVLAIAQMGVHLVFFLHITSGPDNANNMLALAFGTLIVILLIAGSLWIMSHLDHAMPSMDAVMSMQR